MHCNAVFISCKASQHYSGTSNERLRATGEEVQICERDSTAKSEKANSALALIRRVSWGNRTTAGGKVDERGR